MSYEINFSDEVLKFLKNLNDKDFDRFEKKMFAVAENPSRYIKHLESKEFNKIRIGKLRLLVDVDNKRKIIFVRVIGFRKNIYKKIN